MCGIIGSLTTSKSFEDISSAMSMLKHRGPDDHALENFPLPNGHLILGHQRLSIIDLSSNGRQPMVSIDGRYSIIFNGEIYNYKELRTELESTGQIFRTDTDTEVLLNSWIIWNKNSLSKLKGMFAFVIFDKHLETITCIRDAFGIKPLYYYYDKERFFFSSEIPPLLNLSKDRQLNHQAVYDFLLYGSYDKDENTFYANIKSLLPCTILTVKLNPKVSLSFDRWWLPKIDLVNGLSFSEAADKLRDIFLTNIRLHMRSDVPLGATLSGGLDSSAVVCAMRYLEPEMPIHTFTYVARGSKLNEEVWADIVNKHVGAIPHKVSASNVELIGDLDDLIRGQGEPFSTSSIYAQYRVFKAVKEAGIVVTLDGQGGDEILAGYEGYPHQYLESHFDNMEFRQALRFMRNFNGNPYKTPLKPAMEILRNFIPKKIYKSIINVRNGQRIPSWVIKKEALELGLNGSYSENNVFKPKSGRKLVSLLAEELIYSRIPRLLRYADRNSMNFSIESRVPFLTTDLANFTLSLPESYLVSETGESKNIFKHAMRGIVPDDIIGRKDKIGFETPEHELVKLLPSSMTNLLNGLEGIPYIDLNALRESMKFKIHSENYNSQIWRIIVLSRWIELNQT